MKKRFIFAENLHNMKPNTVILVGILFMLSLSCQKNDKQLITQPLEQNEGLKQIPVEEALRIRFHLFNEKGHKCHACGQQACVYLSNP